MVCTQKNLASLSSESKQTTTVEHNRVFTAPLPDPISANIEAIASLHNQGFRDLPCHQQWLEKGVRFFIRPVFLYCLLFSFVIWISGSLFARAGYLPFEGPMFSWSGQGLDAAALLISTGVLVRQSRQENFAEQRAQLSLQLSLLSEQKIAKIISLLEELRDDLPNVDPRHDPEAQMMQEAADPLLVIAALKKNLEQELLAEPGLPGNLTEHKTMN